MIGRLDAADRAIIRRARELADSIEHNREAEYSGKTDQSNAYAACLGASGVLLDNLLEIITRLDSTP